MFKALFKGMFDCYSDEHNCFKIELDSALKYFNKLVHAFAMS